MIKAEWTNADALNLQPTCNQLATDCISRQAAIDTLHMDTSIIPYKKAREYADATILEIRNRLEKLPSAQPEIIRCKDCMWVEERNDSLDKTPYWMCKIWNSETDAEGFCYKAYGKENR